MAHIYPRIADLSTAELPQSEKKAYSALAQGLPDSYTVLFGIHWTGKQALRGSQDFECDFIVTHPEKGFLVVEVKGGGIRYDGQADRWQSINPRGAFTIKNPIEQALKNKHALKNFLFSKFAEQYKHKPQLRLAHCVWFIDTDTVSGMFPRAHPDIVLDRSSLHSVHEHIDRAIDFYAEEHRRFAGDKATISKAIALLLPSGELKRSIVKDIEFGELEILELTNAQLKVLRSLRRQRRVLIAGGAGTGKTVLGIEKAKEEAAAGKKVLFTCYSRPVAQRLAASYETEGLTIMNFHRLCHDYGKVIGREQEFEQQANYTSSDFWNYTSVEILEQAIATNPEAMTFDTIVVDEVQDFSPTWLNAIVSDLVKNPDQGEGCIYLLGDASQTIFERDGAAEILSSFATYELHENLRNTKAIFRCYETFANTGCDACGPDGAAVELLPTADKDLEILVDKKVKALRSEKITPAAITVLSASRPANYLPGLAENPAYTTDVLETGKVLLSTIHSYKGLENDVIIVCGLEKLPPNKRTELLYVACSRAKHLLIVFGAEEDLAFFGKMRKRA